MAALVVHHGAGVARQCDHVEEREFRHLGAVDSAAGRDHDLGRQAKCVEVVRTGRQRGDPAQFRRTAYEDSRNVVGKCHDGFGVGGKFERLAFGGRSVEDGTGKFLAQAPRVDLRIFLQDQELGHL